MTENEKINYIEFPANNIEATKSFFTSVFDWQFIDYGPEYSSFSNQGIDGGFFKSNLSASTNNGSALIIFYSQNLESTQLKIEQAGGVISKAIFSFPGGRRFHFIEPSNNEFAVWSDTNA
ncbi:VOC family protein [Candidatus Nitrotoga sp. M5]|uniref:VOC family protein n=1 Tax=Candidatus Nitrotoga sp. M5 TaxID=2890409 RepID=UPI001EF6AAE4|nr:VOC family protein [Candidatus Nitrotoga sp. M5]CAH1388187.1 Glyoxalase family protein [Candidatus Nitrotoga sp. M5]